MLTFDLERVGVARIDIVKAARSWQMILVATQIIHQSTSMEDDMAGDARSHSVAIPDIHRQCP